MMIDRQKLRKLHEEDLPLHILEQDYIQALFLTELYSKTEKLVFKGGTYLKHAYGLDRFSEDLDFTAVEENVEKDVRSAKDALEDYGIAAEIDKVNENSISFSCRLRFEGPLYKGKEQSRGSVEIDISKREDVLLEPEWKRLFFEYPETRVVNALGLKKKELLAEKLRALSTREKARDLYDCWFLMKQGTGIDLKLFQKKMKVVDAEPVIEIAKDQQNWKGDLEMFLENPPEFNQVKEEVMQILEEEGFEMKTS
ncbi:MAG: hypothetical protein BRC29_00835 [Nanohaloarchaea archaeon SW_7_43_1]|nr:MAG: hypothetical protein BRC29_00835 [Nanohaloarchaea archaeon SW_7_43_1]